VFKEKKDALEAEAQLMKAKGKWWAEEAEQRKVRLVKAKLFEIADAVRVRSIRVGKERAVKRAQLMAKERKVLEEADKAEMILRALHISDKWKEQHACSEEKAALERRLFADLMTKGDFLDHELEVVVAGLFSYLPVSTCPVSRLRCLTVCITTTHSFITALQPTSSSSSQSLNLTTSQ
jgi:hypothetical protein